MKKFLTDNRINANVFCLFLFIFFMLFSFDRFCFDTVTTETPLLKLGELPLLRTEFVAFLFSVTAIAGAVAGTVLRVKGKGYYSLPVTLLGAIALFLTFFDVDTLQILAPDMRISHVIMTVSRVSAITAGVSGVFVGLALSLTDFEKRAGAMFAGVLAATLLSILTVQEKLYTMCFAIVSVALIVTGIAGQYFNADKPVVYSAPVTAGAVAEAADRLFSTFGMTVMSLTLCGYLTDTEGYGYPAYFICVCVLISSYALAKKTGFKAVVLSSALALALTGAAIASRQFPLVFFACIAAGFAFGSCRYNKYSSLPWDFLISAIAVFIGATVSYYVVHELSQTMTFSANRIVYLVQSNLFVPVVIALGIKLLCHILNRIFDKKGELYDNSVSVG